jgi:hypothetical protein
MPGIPGPEGEPPDVDDLAPLTKLGIELHVLGALLNATGLALACGFLAVHTNVSSTAGP